MTIYECGAMTAFYKSGEYDKATKWRNYVKEYFKESNIKIFDPTDNSEMHFNHPVTYYNGVILQNYTYLKECDLVLVNLEYFEESIGSIWEVSAAWLEHKPVIAFGRCKKFEDRPHYKSLITLQLPSVEDACDYILSMYRQKI